MTFNDCISLLQLSNLRCCCTTCRHGVVLVAVASGRQQHAKQHKQTIGQDSSRAGWPARRKRARKHDVHEGDERRRQRGRAARCHQARRRAGDRVVRQAPGDDAQRKQLRGGAGRQEPAQLGQRAHLRAGPSVFP